MTRGGALVDRFARRITYLRLSVTDRCDLRCTYCMPERQVFLPRADVLTLDELHRMSLRFIARGIAKLRITGGEPLVRRDVMDLIQALGRELGREPARDTGAQLRELTLTTNGTQLANHADALRAAGIRRINVSLDTRDRALFAKLTRRDLLPRVLDGLAAAREAGLRVKINTVALRGVNEDEIADLVAWAHGQGFDLSLIEVMPLGDVDVDRVDQYLPLTAVRERLERCWTLTPSDHRSGGPARYFDVAETGGRLGLITPLTGNFCEGCNRIRVTATGQLYACLGGHEKVDLRAALRSGDADRAIEAAMDRAMRIKPARHNFAISDQGVSQVSNRHMSTTGG